LADGDCSRSIGTCRFDDRVFSDVVMSGGMSGFELVTWVGVHKPEVKLLLTSGFTEEVAGVGVAGQGSPRLLRKPYSTAQLASAIAMALDDLQCEER
jgi:DNA-binding NtrC family response regulator